MIPKRLGKFSLPPQVEVVGADDLGLVAFRKLDYFCPKLCGCALYIHALLTEVAATRTMVGCPCASHGASALAKIRLQFSREDSVRYLIRVLIKR